ncbi:glycosyltransferase family protein [Muricoccus radiodurans]|uniref:glycosyltransferase n=1 Tax=Muricoccus radiodurans TaxID=2231721 RepID=UPI003CF0E374
MGIQRPRVLEIGPFCLFAQAWPETTEFLFAGAERYGVAGALPARFRRERWRGAEGFDLVVAHTAAEDWSRPEALKRLLAPRRRADAAAALAWELARQGAGPRVPVAVLDMHDERAIHRRDLPLLRSCVRYFKRELPANAATAFAPGLRGPGLDALLPKLRPISLGLSAAVVAEAPSGPVQKEVDVFFAGHLSHAPEIRGAGLAQIEALAAEGVRVDVARKRMPRPDFLARCARARIVWSPEGLGWDCFRHYEAALCGAVPLVNLPSIRRHAPLSEGEHAIHYAVEEDGLRRAVLGALRDPGRLEAMGRAARDHMLRHHTHDALCDYVVRECLGR